MQKIAAVAFAATLVASVAAAQMKVPAQQPRVTATSQSPSNPSPIKVEMAPAAQALQAAEPSIESAKRISREEAIKLVKEHKAIWVDVRPKESYDAGHIKGAINIPLTDLPAHMGELPKNKEIITYCAWVQEHTSARAVLDLNAKGIKNTAALLGGWNGWVTAKEPIETTPVKKK